MNETRIRPIRNDNDYSEALERIEGLMDAAPGSWQMDELEVLAQLVEAYEDKEWPMGVPSPAAAIKFRMEQSGLTPRDLETYIGSSDVVSGVLSGKQSLTLEMIRALHQHLRISLDVLFGDPDSRMAKTQ
jgi:HTH-type transcriptional regulator/antitoxin HigA